MFQEQPQSRRGKRSPPAAAARARGLLKILGVKPLPTRMLQHVMRCVALHNIVCLTYHGPSLMMVQRSSDDDCWSLRIFWNMREIKDKSSAVTYGSK
jgi:hypothetical protein